LWRNKFFEQGFTFDAEGEVEPGHLFAQVKATDHLRTHVSGGIALRVERRDLERWCREWIPVILVLYDVAQDVAYAKVIRREHLPRHEASTITLVLEREAILGVELIQTLAGEKRRAQRVIEELLNGTD
jgi:hypothetical protein